jgi:large repetitive protein
MVGRLVAVVLVVCLVLTGAAETHPADAKNRKRGKPKTITREFTSADVPLTIPQSGTVGLAAPFPSAVEVGGFRKGTVLDVNLVLVGITHDGPVDIDLALVAPGGRTAQVMSDVGGLATATNVTLTLDDQATNDIPFLLESGTFRPTDRPGAGEEISDFDVGGAVSLATFNGLDPNGTWSILVQDDQSGDVGSLSGWRLVITAKVKTKKK